jgi:hypothetical protein
VVSDARTAALLLEELGPEAPVVLDPAVTTATAGDQEAIFSERVAEGARLDLKERSSAFQPIPQDDGNGRSAEIRTLANL